MFYWARQLVLPFSAALRPVSKTRTDHKPCQPSHHPSALVTAAGQSGRLSLSSSRCGSGGVNVCQSISPSGRRRGGGDSATTTARRRYLTGCCPAAGSPERQRQQHGPHLVVCNWAVGMSRGSCSRCRDNRQISSSLTTYTNSRGSGSRGRSMAVNSLAVDWLSDMQLTQV